MAFYMQRLGGIDPRNSLQVKQTNKPKNPEAQRGAVTCPRSQSKEKQSCAHWPCALADLVSSATPFPETHSPARVRVCGGTGSPSQGSQMGTLKLQKGQA